MDWFLGDDDDDFGKKSFYFNHFFSFQESNRGAPLTFVPELHSWVNATTEYGMVVQYVYPPPSARFWSSFSLIQSKLT